MNLGLEPQILSKKFTDPKSIQTGLAWAARTAGATRAATAARAVAATGSTGTATKATATTKATTGCATGVAVAATKITAARATVGHHVDAGAHRIGLSARA